MKATELITKLQELVDRYGDLTMEIRDSDDGYSDFDFEVYADPLSEFESDELGTITIGVSYL